MISPDISRDGHTFIVHVPFKIRTRGGKKLVVTPDGSDWRPDLPRFDNALIKALGRAFRWRKLLEFGTYATTRELAVAEKINESYACRLIRVALLAPDIVDTILAGKQAISLQLHDLLKPLPVEWDEQRRRLSR